ncbi:MAG: CHAT domain-containing protein [Acidobacteria bacterium]|nr:CHAT domain-containing protein [Acidobacteriota bacterium]
MFRLLLFLALAQDGNYDAILTQLESAPDPAAIVSSVPPSPQLLEACRAKAEAQFKANKFASALALHQAAFALALRLNQPSSAARTQRAIGLCYRRMGRQQDSLDANLLGLKYSQPAADHQASCDLYRGAGLAQRALGLPRESIASFRIGSERCRDAKDIAGALRSLANLAIVLTDIGEYREAVRVLLACLQESGAVQDRELQLALLDNIAVAYMRQGDKLIGRSYLEQALAAKQAAGFPANEIALTRTNLIPVYLELNQLQAALRISAQVLEQEAIIDPRIRATCLVNRAGAYRRMGRPAEAAADLLAARKLFLTVQGTRQAAEVLPHLAFTALDRNDNAAALELAIGAERETRETGAVEPHRLALDARATAHLRLGDSASARSAFLDEIRLLEAQRDLLAGGNTQDLQFLATRGNPYYQLMALEVDAKRPEEALQHLEGAKGRILADILRNSAAIPSAAMTAAERQQEEQFRSRVLRLAAPALQGAAKAREQWEAANRDLDAFRANLYVAHPELRMRRAEFSPAPLSQIRTLLANGSSAIEFGVANGKLYSFFIPGSGTRIVVHVQPWEPVRQLAAGFRESIVARDLSYRIAAAQLYNLLIAPFESQLPRGGAIVLLPEGELWNIPFAALVSATGKHLLEEHPLHYAPSMTVLQSLTTRTPRTNPAGTLLALGAPSAGPFAGALPPLQSSAAEVHQVASVYQSPKILLGHEASRDAWLAEAPRHRVLHLSTHGILNAVNPLYSYLVLSNGVLESREVLQLPLQADLVVLSACQTASSGPNAGEGLIGLTWAFLAAGSNAAVASQWQADSAGTSHLMTALHRNVRQGRINLSHAMQRAALDLMKRPEYRHPFYWAAFMVVGKGN